MLYNAQRPLIVEAEDIGIIQDILQFLEVISVSVNAGICLYLEPIPGVDTLGRRLQLFIAYHAICLLAKGVVKWYLPEQGVQAKIQIERSTFLESKLIDFVPDLEANTGQAATILQMFSTANDDEVSKELDLETYPTAAIVYDKRVLTL